MSDAAPLTSEETMYKALHHMIHKARQHFVGGRPVGYVVPLREFNRVRNRYNKRREERFAARQEAQRAD